MSVDLKNKYGLSDSQEELVARIFNKIQDLRMPEGRFLAMKISNIEFKIESVMDYGIKNVNNLDGEKVKKIVNELYDEIMSIDGKSFMCISELLQKLFGMSDEDLMARSSAGGGSKEEEEEDEDARFGIYIDVTPITDIEDRTIKNLLMGMFKEEHTLKCTAIAALNKVKELAKNIKENALVDGKFFELQKDLEKSAAEEFKKYLMETEAIKNKIVEIMIKKQKV